MHARVTTIEMDASQIDEAISQLEERDVPTFKEIDGFRGMTVFVDRSSGKAIASTYWGSEEQMRTSEESVKEARQRAADTGGASGTPQVELFEVVLDTFVR